MDKPEKGLKTDLNEVIKVGVEEMSMDIFSPQEKYQMFGN